MWQVRHKTAGVFMGVNHGKGHYHLMSDCCRSLGVYQFTTSEQVQSLFEMASSPHLPERARMKREDLIVEEWNLTLHDMLLDEGLLDDCRAYLQWSFSVFPVSFKN